MRASRFLSALAALALVAPALCTGKEVLGIPCSKAISEAELLAANRKWSSARPDPTALVLNISTSMNYAKAVLLGPVFSHPKLGELTFDDTISPNVCQVASNGHPADVVLQDLKKKFGESVGASGATADSASASPDQAEAYGQQPAKNDAGKAHAMTDSDVMTLTKAGFAPQVINAKIQSSDVNFDTSTAALTELRSAGVTDSVILAMIEAQDAKTMKTPIRH